MGPEGVARGSAALLIAATGSAWLYGAESAAWIRKSLRIRPGAVGLSLVSGRVGTIARVPRISEFYGIVIEMYFDDHPPPHFHARHSDHAAVLSVDGELLAGSLPAGSLRLVQRWVQLHRDELLANWQRLERDEAPRRIDPLP